MRFYLRLSRFVSLLFCVLFLLSFTGSAVDEEIDISQFLSDIENAVVTFSHNSDNLNVDYITAVADTSNKVPTAYRINENYLFSDSPVTAFKAAEFLYSYQTYANYDVMLRFYIRGVDASAGGIIANANENVDISLENVVSKLLLNSNSDNMRIRAVLPVKKEFCNYVQLNAVLEDESTVVLYNDRGDKFFSGANRFVNIDNSSVPEEQRIYQPDFNLYINNISYSQPVTQYILSLYFSVADVFDRVSDFVSPYSFKCEQGFSGGLISLSVSDSALDGQLSDLVDGVASIDGKLSDIDGSLSNIEEEVSGWQEKMIIGIQLAVEDLFVPDDRVLTAKIEELENVVEEGFPAFVELSNVIDDFGESFKEQAENAELQKQIYLPEITLSFSDNVNNQEADFSFGGFDVDIIPEGFEFIVDSLKIVVNILCTVYVVMAVKHKIEIILAGSDNV